MMSRTAASSARKPGTMPSTTISSHYREKVHLAPPLLNPIRGRRACLPARPLRRGGSTKEPRPAPAACVGLARITGCCLGTRIVGRLSVSLAWARQDYLPAPKHQPFERDLDNVAVKECDDSSEDGCDIDEQHHGRSGHQHPRHAIIPSIRASFRFTKAPSLLFDPIYVSHDASLIPASAHRKRGVREQQQAEKVIASECRSGHAQGRLS